MIKAFLKIAGSALKRWWDKDPFMQSAIIAYYAIFSMPGLLVIIISIGALFFKNNDITGQLYTQISSIMGKETAKQIQDMIVNISNTNKSAFVTTVGLITVLLGATGVFVELQKALNVIWDVKAKPQKAILTLIRTRLFSFGLLLSVCFLLLISLTLTTIIEVMGAWVMNHWPNIIQIIFYVVHFIISFGVIMLLFALLFKILPDAKIKWKHLWWGSILTTFLFIVGKNAIGFYLTKTNPASAYGAAGSIVLILLWVSYTSMILFYGAEFTRAYADYFTGHVAPTDVAVKVL
jgi:membrane protein